MLLDRCGCRLSARPAGDPTPSPLTYSPFLTGRLKGFGFGRWFPSSWIVLVFSCLNCVTTDPLMTFRTCQPTAAVWRGNTALRFRLNSRVGLFPLRFYLAWVFQYRGYSVNCNFPSLPPEFDAALDARDSGVTATTKGVWRIGLWTGETLDVGLMVLFCSYVSTWASRFIGRSCRRERTASCNLRPG